MKKHIGGLLLILFLLSIQTKAALIDMTPGGFTNFGPSTPIAWDWWIKVANHNQSYPIADVIINGDTLTWYFPMSESFSVTLADTSAELSWDLQPLFSNYSVHYLWINSLTGSNLYHVTALDELSGGGFVTVDGASTLNQIVFYGSLNGVPDIGNSIVLFAAALGLLLTYQGVLTPKNK